MLNETAAREDQNRGIVCNLAKQFVCVTFTSKLRSDKAVTIIGLPWLDKAYWSFLFFGKEENMDARNGIVMQFDK